MSTCPPASIIMVPLLVNGAEKMADVPDETCIVPPLELAMLAPVPSEAVNSVVPSTASSVPTPKLGEENLTVPNPVTTTVGLVTAPCCSKSVVESATRNVSNPPDGDADTSQLLIVAP